MNPITYFLLTLFGGPFGIHKFATGKKGMGILYLCTAGLYGIGWIIDIVVAFKNIFSSTITKAPDSVTYESSSTNSTEKVVSNICNVNIKDFDKYKKCFIAFDLETTGLNAKNDRIIELSAVIFRDFVPCERFSSLINPQIPIPASASKINHIYDKDVLNAPLEKDCIKSFCEFIGKNCLNGKIALVAHNAPFDSKFLSIALNKCGIENKITYLDTLRIARNSNLGLTNNKLGTLAKHFKIEQHSAHRAEDDARVCGEIFVKLLQLQK